MIRFFCTVRSVPSFWGDLSFLFFEMFRQMGHPIRVLPIGNGDPGDSSSRWAPHFNAFMQPVGNDYVNVVCGDGCDLVRLFTVGVKNIAITDHMRAFTDKEVAALQEYDAVLCPSAEGVVELGKQGVLAFHISAYDTYQLARVMAAI